VYREVLLFNGCASRRVSFSFNASGRARYSVQSAVRYFAMNPDCFGGIIFDGHDRVLIRKPTEGWGGFAWTFAKGTPEAGETPERTALREVLEETGYLCEIVCRIPDAFESATSLTAYFIMRPLGQPTAFDSETEEVRWVTVSEARSMLAESSTVRGRARDLAALEAAVVVRQNAR
jgi:8-oxo-dGTP diphosphatase